MHKSIIALGIESSCDDTSVGIIKIDLKENLFATEGLISKKMGLVTVSQDNLHKDYGGVVPEIAARAHSERIDVCFKKVLKKSNVELDRIDIICVTAGPGLIGGLLSGVNFAKGLAFSTGKPLIGVNHLIGHALTPQMTDNLSFPYLILLASGGHCQYLAVLGANKIERLGTTIDDAPGEVFDKVAKMLGLPVFSGSEVEKYAKKGNKNRFSFPLPLVDKNNCDLSFSGLKSSVRRQVDRLVEKQSGLYVHDQRDICASFQESMKLIFENKTKKALELFAKFSSEKEMSFSLAGGVAANQTIRDSLKELCKKLNVHFSAPPLDLCTDNGLMIAFAGSQIYLGGNEDNVGLSPQPRWPIDIDNKKSFGSGKRGRKV
ncbi:tRNA (adenosine(37)-N6)-threonylcarbamoyltransferase complex transferase subunit TsaD [Paracoccaceae bacterium]|nr:tRNA (adenosine(37)-N6)-threonylcarbamoyltransferase complex transferase subunit TsaD [Paracoccaceae bacterium]